MIKNFKSKEPGIPYFVTFTVVEWLNVFTKPEYLRILWDSLQYCRREKGLNLYGFVFMTNHIHLIVSAGNEDNKLWQIIRDFKKFTAQKIIQSMQTRSKSTVESKRLDRTNENRRWILDIMKKAGTKIMPIRNISSGYKTTARKKSRLKNSFCRN